MLGTLLRELFGGGSNYTRLHPADIDYGTDAGMQELINSLSPIGAEFDQKRQRKRQRRLAISGMIEDGFALCDARLDAFPQTVEDHEALLQAHKEARRVVLRTLIARHNYDDVDHVLCEDFNQSLMSDYGICRY